MFDLVVILLVRSVIYRFFGLTDASAVATAQLEVSTSEFSEVELNAGVAKEGYVSYSISTQDFYIQLSETFPQLCEMMDEIAAVYSKGVDGVQASSLKAGITCVALFAGDGGWYRGSVKKILSPGEVDVEYVDYGNSAKVSISDLKPLYRKFAVLPKQAIHCRLASGDVAFSANADQLFKTAVEEQSLTTVFTTCDNGVWSVSLSVKDVSITDLPFVGASESMPLSENATQINKFTTEESESPVPETLLQKEAGASEAMLEPQTLDQIPITPGQTAEVYLSHVNNPGDFFVQMSETATELEVLTNQIGERYPCLGPNDCPLKKCEVGSVCCAPFTNDSCFYRAVVKSILADSQVQLKFVDFGNCDTVPLTSLKSLAPDLAKAPCQAVKCSLMDRQSHETDKYTALLEELFDKPLQATFVKQEESTWMVVIEHEGKCIMKSEEQLVTGVSQAETKLSVEIPANVEQREFEVVSVTQGQTAEVYLVHTVDPSSFYVQLSESATDFDIMMAHIEAVYALLGSTEETFDTVTVNSLCCAKFEEDHQWYRAIVRNVPSDTMVEVEFFDYGNTQLVPLSTLKVLRKEFMKLPRQAVHCGMVNVKDHWTDKDIEVFQSILGEKPINTSFICQEGATWLVQLDCEGVAVNEHEQFKKVSDIPEVKSGEEAVAISYAEPILGHREPVYLLSKESANTLWLQVATVDEELETLMTNIANCSGLHKLEPTQLREGLPCLGMFTEDGKWYRACVVEYNTEGVCVRYVDYGNSEWIPLDKLRIIRDEFLQLPLQAFLCKLEGVEQVNDDQLFELCDQKLLEVEIVSREPSGIYVLKLLDPQSNQLLNERVSGSRDAAPLVTDSPAQATVTAEAAATSSERTFSRTEIKAGDSLTMFVTVVDSPDSLWCQLDDPENKLEQLMSEIDNYYSKLENEELALQAPTPGDMCCGQYTADDVWYRAEVQEVCNDGNISVHFVDYGNDELLPSTRVKKLLEQFQVLPAQAVNCSLFGVEPVNGGSWSEDANEKFHDLCSDKSLVGKVWTVNQLVLEVELTDKEDRAGMSLNSQLIAAGLAREAGRKTLGSATNEDVSSKLVYNLLNLPVGSKATVTVTNTVNPGQFWCQVTETSDELFSLMEELETYCTTTPELDLTMSSIGTPCCAKFAEDELWYRAVITGVCTDVEVCYVDYGNNARVPLSDIKIMNEKFVSLPIQAVQCCLDGASPDADGIWQAGGTEYFQALVLDQELELTVVSAESGKYVVTLSANGVDLGTAMSTEVSEVSPTTSIEGFAVPHQEAAGTKDEQEVGVHKSVVQPGPTEIGKEESTAKDVQGTEGPECISDEATKLDTVGQEVVASPSTEEETFEDTVEHVEVVRVITFFSYRTL